MSNTSSNKTSKTNKQTVKVIVGEIGRDTKTGILGRGYSYDNGATFHVTDTMFGRLYDKDDGERMWPNMAHKVADEIKSATADLPNVRKQADEAVKFAESAVAASKVNSDAIVAQSEAISEAKAAMDSATAEIQQTAANAASDAAKIRADVAQVQNEVDTAKMANSASVEALKSDVSAAKQDLADVHDSLTKAQSAIEQNQKLINDSVAKITSDVSATKQDLADVHDSLTKAQAAAEENQKAIDKSIAQINTNVDATNQDLAGVRKDLTKAQSDIAANQKAINDNVAQINSDIAQDRKDIASAQQANADTAKQLDAYSKQAQEQGRTIKAVQDKQDGFSIALADVQGNVAQVSDKVDGLSASLKDAQGNVASVKAQADQLSATLTDHGKAIATLAASAKELSSTLEDADGRLSKVEQTAQTNSSTLSDVQGDLSQVKQDATTLTATLKDAQGNISTLQQKADSVSAQLASAQGDIATLQTGVDSVKATLTSHDKSIHTLQADSKSLKDSMADAQGDISTLSKTATDVTSELEDHTGRLSKVEQTASKQATTLSDLQGNLSQVEQKADSNTATISSINKNAMQDRGAITDTKTSFDSLTQLGTYSIKASGLSKMPEQHYGTLVVSGSAGSGWLSQQFVADTTGNVYTRVFSNNAWSAWKQGGSQDAINQVKQTADSNSATIRNVQGDVSALKQTATDVEAALADHEGDIHTLQADNKSLKDSMADAQGDISTLSKTATSLDSEMKDHAGRLSKVEQSATTQATTLSDLQGNLSQVKQQADGLVTTLKDAQGSITQIQQKADGTLEQLKSAQGDIASLQTDVTGIKATLVSHEGDIHTLQADSKSLRDSMQDAQGDISTLKKTSTDVTAELKDHDGRISKTEQTASTLVNEFADQQGHLNRVEQTAQGTQQTVANQQGQINTIETDVSGMHQTITGQGNQITSINVTLSSLNTKYEGVSGDLNNLKSQAQWVTVTSAVDLNNVKTPCHEFLKGTVTNAPNETAWWYLTVESSDDGNRVTQTVIADQSNNRYTRRWADGWSAWVKDATQTDVTALSDRITTNSTQITQNKQAITLKADQTTVDNLTGEVSQAQAQLKVQAGQISSKVSSTDFKALNDKFDGMKIGGRNLVAGTAEPYTMGYGIPNTVWKDGYAYLKLPSNTISDEVLPQDPHTFFHVMTKGTTYTQTIWLETDAKFVNSSGMQITWFTSAGHDGQPTTLVKLGENKYKLYSTYTWPGKSDNSVRLFDTFDLDYAFDLSTGTYFKFGKLKLEEGNVSTDWTPAPEDTITAIQKNSTAIDQTNKQISLKADQTEVDQVKQTVTQNSSRLNVMANEISSKVTSTDVNNIINGKGYATTSTVQSLITQKAGTINESIVKLDQSVKTGAENNVQLVRKSDFEDGDKGSWSVQGVIATDPPAELGQSGMKVLQTNARDAYENDIWYSVKPGEKFDVDFWCKPSPTYDSQFGLDFVDKNKGNHNWIGVYVNKSNQWQHYTGTITAPVDASFARPWFQMSKDASNTTDTALLAKPSIRRQNATTVAAIQHIAASIDGVQSTVANKADKSQITQLSNVIQSKVSSSDFNDLKDKTTWKSTDSIDLNTAVSQQKIFVKGGSNLPPGDYWWYVQVESGYDSRIVQYAVSDRDNKQYRRQYDGSRWSAWSQGATESEITQLRDDINLRVKSGDLLSQINLTAGNTLIQSNKLYLDASSVAFSGRAFIPSAAIAELDADKLTFYGNGSKASIGASVAQYDQDAIKSTINLQYQGGFEIHSSNQLGSILTMHDNTVRLAVKSNGMANHGSPTDQYSGFYASTSYSLMNSYLKDGTTSGIAIGSADSGVNKDYRIHIYDGSNASNNLSKGVSISSSSRFDVYAGNSQLFLGPDKAEIRSSNYATLHGNNETYVEGGNEQIYIHNGEVCIGMPGHESDKTSVHLRVFGWADFNGWMNVMGLSQTSLLSTKTRIEPLDTKDALDKIMAANVETYQFKSDVAEGKTKRHASVIIDDVHDVSQYYTPEEFISENRKGRDDGDIVGYLMGAVQELKKQLDEMKKEVQING